MAVEGTFWLVLRFELPACRTAGWTQQRGTFWHRFWRCAHETEGSWLWYLKVYVNKLYSNDTKEQYFLSELE